jgi:hypothetical protein
MGGKAGDASIERLLEWGHKERLLGERSVESDTDRGPVVLLVGLREAGVVASVVVFDVALTQPPCRPSLTYWEKCIIISGFGLSKGDR